MTIKRFVAPTMRRALDLVRLEMGPDAIILSSQKVKGGIEVITSTEVDLPTRGASAGKDFSQRFDTEVDTPLASDQAWQAQQGAENAAKQYVKPASVHSFKASLESVSSESTLSKSRSSELAKEIEAARERMLAAKSQPSKRSSPKEREESSPQEPRRPYDSLEPYVQVERGQAEELQVPDLIEAQAAVPHAPVSHSSEYQNPVSQTQGHQPDIVAAPVFEAPEYDVPQNVDRQMAGLHEQVQHLTDVKEEAVDKSNAQLTLLQSEIADMRMLLEQQMMRGQEGQAVPQVHSMFTSPVTEALHGHLSGLGLPQGIIKTLSVGVNAGKPLNESWREALARLAKLIKVNTSDDINRGGIFAFVGSTGVGKTTTIAKLAAKYVLEHGMGKVALITTDTYRVGAHDQLRSLGRILNVPVRVVDQERSLASVVSSLKSFPLILIDTAGFRQGDPLLNQQESMLASCPSLNRVLVLACNAQVQTLKASAHAFGSENLAGCILTKLDECGSLGEMLGVLIQHDLPVMYSSDGQSIPNDLEKASAPNLVAKAVSLMKGQQLQSKVAVGHP